MIFKSSSARNYDSEQNAIFALPFTGTQKAQLSSTCFSQYSNNYFGSQILFSVDNVTSNLGRHTRIFTLCNSG